MASAALADAYSRLAGVYDELVVDPAHHDRCASFLHERWSADEAGVRRVLDVCCGTGLLTAELVARGYRVVGVDASAAMLARARERLGPAATLERMVLPDLAVGGVFDAAVCAVDGFNYLTPANLRRSLVALGRRLRPGGWLVFDLHTDTLMHHTLRNPVVDGTAEGSRFVIRSTVDPAARTCDTRIDVTDAGASFAEEHRQYFHREDDVRAALAAAGCVVAAVTDDYTARPADASTLLATWSARRAT
jgi:SAM-dependent methyltransferase